MKTITLPTWAYVAVLVLTLFAGTTLGEPALAGGAETHPKCHEDAAVVRVLTEWNGDRQVRVRDGAIVCAPLDDLYLP